MKSRVHPKYKTQDRVGNWPEYDRALVQRGDVTVWLTPDAIVTWAAAGVGKCGGQLQYSDAAIETALTLAIVRLERCARSGGGGGRKKVSGYDRQARVENGFFRYKSIIGDAQLSRAGRPSSPATS